MIEIYFRIPTVRVKRDGGRGFRIINATEYDPAKHVLADEQPNAAQVEPRQQPRKLHRLELKNGTHHR